MLYKCPRSTIIIEKGQFAVHVTMPGAGVPGYPDHGYGALAGIAESILYPGTLIRMHEHVHDEIVSYVPQGVMRHDDRTQGNLIVDPGHLMVMNAGRSFWHEERTLETDPKLRMLQIFVRPRALGLEPVIQHGPVAPAPANQWRHLFGPEGGKAPFFVRNDVHFYDIRLEAGVATTLPELRGWGTVLYVYSGAVDVCGSRFGEGESAIVTSTDSERLLALETAVVVAFVINPKAAVTCQGTAGDGATARQLFELHKLEKLARAAQPVLQP
jgi:quercetin 2,3-dioxygenase